MTTQPSASQLQELLDKQAIHENLMAYVRSIDRNDIDTFASTYWPEAWDDHGLFKGPVTELVKLNRELKDGDDPHKMTWMTHHVTNEYTKVEGNLAWREAYFIGVHGCEVDGDAMLYTLGGRYLDKLEKRDGAWKVADRVVVADWETLVPATGGLWQPSPWVQGQRSTNDIIYRRWGS